MTVKELKDKLQNYEDNANVWVILNGAMDTAEDAYEDADGDLIISTEVSN